MVHLIPWPSADVCVEVSSAPHNFIARSCKTYREAKLKCVNQEYLILSLFWCMILVCGSFVYFIIVSSQDFVLVTTASYVRRDISFVDCNENVCCRLKTPFADMIMDNASWLVFHAMIKQDKERKNKSWTTYKVGFIVVVFS